MLLPLEQWAADVSPAEGRLSDTPTLIELIGTQQLHTYMAKGVPGPAVGSFKAKKDKSSSAESHWVVIHASLKLHWRGTGQLYRKPGLYYDSYTPFPLERPPVYGQYFSYMCRDGLSNTDALFPESWLLEQNTKDQTA